ncbi:MAG: 2-dehydropantoate 2-reductase [Pseudomonadota bacterium]
MASGPIITIAGAGSIGCFVGGLLTDTGHTVQFFGRKRIAIEIENNGLHLTDYSGMNVDLPYQQLHINEDASLLSNADIVLVTVKSGATAEMADYILAHANPKVVIVSLQNGVTNAAKLKELLPRFDVRAGMVPFNVVHLGEGKFHRGTSGNIVMEAGNPDLSSTLSVPNLLIENANNMNEVLHGKLLVNLNNALNALSDLTLMQHLSDRYWRTRMAEHWEEGLKVMQAAHINPKPPSPVGASIIPYILRLPTPLFKLIAKQMLTIDPQARSSMWEDLQKGRTTEIDELQGEIIRLGKKHSVSTPINTETYNAIKALEQK